MRWLPLISLQLFSAVVLLATQSATAQTPLTTQLVASGYSSPIFVTYAPGDTTRLFVVEKGGIIKIIKNGTPLATPFLDIDSIVNSVSSEQGLLGLAFDPNYATNGRFFVSYTGNVGGESIIARYGVSANPDIANATAQLKVITVAQPFANHNGGMIAFSPIDGYLYIALGDGGSGGDPQNRAQNLDSLLGKMLRLDVSGAVAYTIPPDNPFIGLIPGRDEIWAYGYRNPWRFSFDRQNGDMWIADVGQGNIEEVDFEPSSSDGGVNYGWRLKEGFNCFNPGSGCDPGGVLTDPITQYFHDGGKCSITGGYIYRGCAIPDLQGSYFYGDYCTGEIWSIRYNGSAVVDSVYRDAAIGQPGFALVSFGEDALGELYIVRISGSIYKIVPDGVPAVPCGPCCVGTVGNVDGVGNVDIADLTYLVDHLFITNPPLPCAEEGNIDGTGNIDIADLTFLVDHLFINNPPVPNCP